METIWKYELNLNQMQVIEMPINAEILCVHSQKDKPCLWVKVNPEEKEVEHRKIEIFSTGQPIEDSENTSRYYIGTCFCFNASFVIHVFENEGI